MRDRLRVASDLAENENADFIENADFMKAADRGAGRDPPTRPLASEKRRGERALERRRAERADG